MVTPCRLKILKMNKKHRSEYEFGNTPILLTILLKILLTILLKILLKIPLTNKNSRVERINRIEALLYFLESLLCNIIIIVTIMQISFLNLNPNFEN